MGQRPGDGAVVDATGRVHATGRLTVADASIVPNATSAVTHIPTVTLAERLAEQIASATSRLGRAYLGNLRVLALSAVLPGQPRIVGDRMVRGRMPLHTQSDYPSQTGWAWLREPRFTGCRAVRDCCVSGRGDAGG